MKRNQLLILLIFVATSPALIGSAPQISISKNSGKADHAEPSGNISIQLKVYKDGEIKENIAFQTVNGKTTFAVESIPEEEGKIQPRRFNGDLVRIDEQTYLLNYNLSQSIAFTSGDGDRKTIQYRDAGWKTQVEIVKDQEVVLMKEADTIYTLLIGGSLNKAR